jgi:hypothetical protein
VSPHRLAGDFSVEASARVIRHYRYAEERMMRIMGGWIALTPELPAKLLLGRHVWDCAQHADAWGRRLPELRAPAQRSEPANDAFVRFMDLVEMPEGRDQTAERLVGVYGVLKPHLVGAYEAHLAHSNPIYEPPTRRILERLIAEERRHVAAGAIVLGRATEQADVQAWRARLVDALAEAGGVTGDGTVPASVEIEDGVVRPDADLVAVEAAFDPARLEPELRTRVEAHARALAAGDTSVVAADLPPDASRDDVLTAYARLARGAETAALVGCAKIGAFRVVKVRLTGPAVSTVVQQRWRRDPAGWRLVAADVVETERQPS